jgi:hypothetical protein
MGVWIDELIRRLARAPEWPLPADRERWVEIAEHVALRENDREQLKVLAGWEPDTDRRFRVDPLAARISETMTSLVFGSVPNFEAAEADDQELLDDVVSENRRCGLSWKDLGMTLSSEGETWWRILVDLERADHPLVEWHSRLGVVPLWIGPKLRAVAFVSRLDPIDENDHQFWRHMELHDDEHVQQLLWLSPTEQDLGVPVELAAHPDTESLSELPWAHDMPQMMAGWIRNREGSNPRKGYSDYDGIEDMLIELHETLTVGHENMKLTAKKRVVVPRSAVNRETGTVDDDQEFFIADSDSSTLGQEPGKGPWQVLEYEFDAAALSQYRRDIAVDALSRKGINAQFASVPSGESDGYATSGVALRLRLIPSVNAGADRAENIDREVPGIFQLVQLLDAAPRNAEENTGGFERPWRRPEERPSFDRGPALPEDEVERDARIATNVEARLLSRRTGIEEQHPEWEDERVIEELRRISIEDGETPDQAAILWPLPGEEEAAAAELQRQAAEEAAIQADALAQAAASNGQGDGASVLTGAA